MMYDIEDGEFEISPFELALMFYARGWGYDTKDGYYPPSESELRKMFSNLVNRVMEDGRPSASERGGRFLAVRHDNGSEDMSNSVDLYLNIGYVWAFDRDEENIDD